MKEPTHKTTLLTLAIVGAATLASLPAASQPVRPDQAPRPDRSPLQRPAIDGFRGTSSAAEGTVRQYLMNPHGEVDGLLLNDGTQINFPPHMEEELVGVVQPDDRVSIQGDRERDSVVKADRITNSRTGRSSDTSASETSVNACDAGQRLYCRLALCAARRSSWIHPCGRHANSCATRCG